MTEHSPHYTKFKSIAVVVDSSFLGDKGLHELQEKLDHAVQRMLLETTKVPPNHGFRFLVELDVMLDRSKFAKFEGDDCD